MNTLKNSKSTVLLFIAFSLSAFLYLNLGKSLNADYSSCIPETGIFEQEEPVKKENAGLLPEVDLFKNTYSKLKEIKPLFKSESTP